MKFFKYFITKLEFGNLNIKENKNVKLLSLFSSNV